MQLAAGQKVGSYILLERIGNPNMGDVWRAHHAMNPAARVAVKCVSDRLRKQPQMLERFARECAVLQRLQHPSIVAVDECVQHEGNLFLVMPYLEGGSLEEKLAASGGNGMPVADALKLAVQVLDALNYAHQQGVIHRDVKPSNILLEQGRAYLSDFGVAHFMSAKGNTPTDSGGTSSYMSPEQIRASETDQRSDVYGLGCVLYEMLTGNPPFPEVATVGSPNQAPITDDQIKFMHLTQAPVSPRVKNPAISARLECVLLTAIAKRPEDRFPGCGSFARALEGALQAQVPVKLAERVSLKNRFAMLLAGWGLGVILFSILSMHDGMREVAAAALALTVTGFLSSMVLLTLLYKAWKAIQDGVTKITPGQAVGRLFIPLFNLFWLSKAVIGFADEYNRFAERHRVAARQDKGIYIAFCALIWTSSLLWQAPEISMLLSLLQQFVVIPILLVTLTKAVNHAPALQSAGR